MNELPVSLPAEIVPLSWLLGVWEGTGVLAYTVGKQMVNREFRQKLSFSHDGQPYLNYSSQIVLAKIEKDELSADHVSSNPSTEPVVISNEIGYWRLNRSHRDSDPGPGLLPPISAAAFTNAEQVETLRNQSGAFDIQLSTIRPDGVHELYLGEVSGPKIQISTDAVMRAPGAKAYASATRVYGLVANHLLWAWDIAALGQELKSHASARLAKVQ